MPRRLLPITISLAALCVLTFFISFSASTANRDEGDVQVRGSQGFDAVVSGAANGIAGDRDSSSVVPSTLVFMDESRPISELLIEFREGARQSPEIALELATRVEKCANPIHVDAHTAAKLVDMGVMTEDAAVLQSDAVESGRSCEGLVEADIELALELLDFAARQGISDRRGTSASVVQYQVGGSLLADERLQGNFRLVSAFTASVVANLTADAARGRPDALFWLSTVYEDGRLVPADRRTALNLFEAYLAAKAPRPPTSAERARLTQLQSPQP